MVDFWPVIKNSGIEIAEKEIEEIIKNISPVRNYVKNKGWIEWSQV